MLIFPFRYKALNLLEKFIVDMTIEVCLEDGQACLISQEVARQMELPKQTCSFDMDYNPSKS